MAWALHEAIIEKVSRREIFVWHENPEKQGECSAEHFDRTPLIKRWEDVEANDKLPDQYEDCNQTTVMSLDDAKSKFGDWWSSHIHLISDSICRAELPKFF